jgi:hypothetical protein
VVELEILDPVLFDGCLQGRAVFGIKAGVARVLENMCF